MDSELPHRHPFIRERAQPKASVQLTIRSGYELMPSHANSIANLVANAVVDLDPANVTITDTDGNSYTIADRDVAALMNNRLPNEKRKRVDFESTEATSLSRIR
ncbi:MAG: hypothetical protein R3C03_15680 [Pirellulaceae bacterium]